MSEFKCGIVVPVGPNRGENVALMLKYLAELTVTPEVVVLVLDGPEASAAAPPLASFPFRVGVINLRYQHHPGLEQPRNVGLREMVERMPEITHAWFLDSDIIVTPEALAQYEIAFHIAGEPTIMVGPYDWLDGTVREPMPELRNDPRWVSFDEYDPTYISRERLNDGLACFGGNLVWPVNEFKRVGGFWNDIHHGRCEDGELGLRAVAEGVPISFVKKARGWHLAHEVNHALAEERNARDVPMLNARHPWVEAGGLVVVERDGKRFDQRCPCGELVNTGDYWNHAKGCGNHISGPIVQTEPALILPDALR